MFCKKKYSILLVKKLKNKWKVIDFWTFVIFNMKTTILFEFCLNNIKQYPLWKYPFKNHYHSNIRKKWKNDPKNYRNLRQKIIFFAPPCHIWYDMMTINHHTSTLLTKKFQIRTLWVPIVKTEDAPSKILWCDYTEIITP